MKRRRFPRRSHWRRWSCTSWMRRRSWWSSDIVAQQNNTRDSTGSQPRHTSHGQCEEVLHGLQRERQKQTGGHDVQMGHWGWLSGERWKWFTMIEEVSHHFWRSVPSCLKECPRGKDNLGRMWEPLKILKGRAETTAGGWTGSMDVGSCNSPDDVSGQRPTGLGWWSPHYQRERTRSKL